MKKRFLISSLKIVFRIFSEYKVRSALAILGITFGTFALILMISISNSLTQKINQEATKLGENIILVKAGEVRIFRGQERALTTANTLKLEEAYIIKNRIEHIKNLAPAYTLNYPLRYKDKIIRTTIIGTTTEYPVIRNIKVKEGRFFNLEEMQRGEKVIVIGSKIAEKFFKNENPIGKTILIFRVPVKVIGVMEEKGADITGNDQDILIYTPIKTAMRRLANVDYINTIYIQADSKESINIVKNQIKLLLRKLHHINPSDKDDFTVISMEDVIKMQTQALEIFKLLGLISAGVSFLIGAIGILSIMILIVNQRKQEIGIRRAVGATRNNILTQFILESGIIAVIGGVFGAFLGVLITSIVFLLFKLPFIIVVDVIIFATISSVILGFIAGIYPAVKASKITPLEALR